MVYTTAAACVPDWAFPFDSSAKLPPEVEVIPLPLHQPSELASIDHPYWGGFCPELSKTQSDGLEKSLSQITLALGDNTTLLLLSSSIFIISIWLKTLEELARLIFVLICRYDA